MPSFDVNLNATLELNAEDWEHLIDCYMDYEGQDEYELKESGEFATLKEAREAMQLDREQAKEQALDELAQDLEGSTLDCIYGNAWVCSVEEPTEM
jgi:predicted neutral ceramidase superfamily lipid hydrolase